jgi:hypothetical protein
MADLTTTIAAIAERWIYRTAHNGPRHLCQGIAADIIAAIASSTPESSDRPPLTAADVLEIFKPLPQAEADALALFIGDPDEEASSIEAGWLIEGKSPGDSAPTWFCAGRGGFNWTKDASAAVRFSRQEDAQRFADWCTITCWPDVTVTEHQWPAPAEARP